MKIVQVTHSFLPFSVGGREEYVLNLCKELSKRHKVVLYTTIESSSPLVRKIKNAKIIYLPAKKIKFGYSFYRIPFTLFHFLMKENFDIIHAHDFFHFTTLISGIVAKLKNKPLIITEHGYYPYGNAQKFIVWVYKNLFVRFIVRNASKIIVASNYMKETIAKKFNIDIKKISVVYPGIEIEKFRHRSPENFILFIGRIVKEKGLHLLIKALKDQHLVVVGPVEDEEYYKKLQKLSKNKKIDFLGKVSKRKLISLLSRCKFVVVPSLYEPFGIVAIESFASGKPVLASRTGGLREIINEKNGETFCNGNLKDLEKKLRIMEKKHFDSKKIVEFSKKFDIKRFSTEIEKIYESILLQQKKQKL